MATKNVVLRPASDVGNGWIQFPNDGRPFFEKVDEPVSTPDDSVTRVETVTVGTLQIFGFGALPPGFGVSTSVKLRVRANSKENLSLEDTGIAFLRIAGTKIITATPFILIGSLGAWNTLELIAPEWVITKGDSVEIQMEATFIQSSGFLDVSAIELDIDYTPGNPGDYTPQSDPTGQSWSALPAAEGSWSALPAASGIWTEV